MRRRVLLVSYHFPPVGGAGVQRPAKFARYLPEFGWDVTVLQAENPSVPLLDQSLLDELPADLVTIKARTLEPGYAAKLATAGSAGAKRTGIAGRLKNVARRAASIALQPDPQVLWLPAARRAALRALRDTPHHAIIATAPSYSNLVLGASLQRRTGLPFVADYRDEWDLSSAYWENAPRDPLSWRVQRGMQRRVLRRAAAVVATTRASTARIGERAAQAGALPILECIYNGWDPSDLAQTADLPGELRREGDRFRLVYAGTLWNLTDVEPVVSAVRQLAESRPDLAARLELVFLGRKTPEQAKLLGQLRDTGVRLTLPDYLPHPVAIATMKSADALLLLLANVPGAERVAPAKLFEYLAVDRPMLAVVPEGETASIVRSIEPDGWVTPERPGQIAAWLTDRLAGKPLAVAPNRDEIRDSFRRREQSAQLAGLLDRVAERST